MQTIDQVLELPEAVNKEHKVKRYVSKVETLDDLKPQQLQAYHDLWNFINSTNGGMQNFFGFAGSGKTYVISKFVEDYLSKYGTHEVAMTAPTNKAVRVINDAGDYYHSNLSYRTIHSLLGLKEQIDHYGRQSFVRDYNQPCDLGEKKLLILDETSMLSDELFLMLIEFVEKGLKVIFVGDPCQINPIGKVEAMPMNDIVCKKYGINTIMLTEIVRQKEGNPIIELATEVRNNLHRPVSFTLREGKLKGNSGVVFLGDDSSDTLENILRTYYNSENYAANSDFVKVIAWRNAVVNFMNGRIRKYIFPDATTKIVVGERLLADKPIVQEDKKIIFTTNDEFIVDSFIIEEEGEDEALIKYYTARVTCYHYNQPRTHTIRIVHEDSDKRYEKLSEDLRTLALNLPKGSFQQKNAWTNFFEFKEYFADTKYAYAVTAHKSQGSTYDTAIVFEGDMDNNKKVLERNRLKYTAFTRASRLLIVVSI